MPAGAGAALAGAAGAEGIAALPFAEEANAGVALAGAARTVIAAAAKLTGMWGGPEARAPAAVAAAFAIAAEPTAPGGRCACCCCE